jgi:molybdopterin-containing oxidoreductase family iron-sulfur binding subunit
MDIRNNEKKTWKSFEELADSDTYRRWVDDEFPEREGLLQIDRKHFLKLGAAGAALAGLSGCRLRPVEKAVPYVRAPDLLVPGRALSYATALTRGGTALGVLVESHEGRPTKIEGNPTHPSSLGATDVWAQAEILSLYDPERSQNVVRLGEPSSWDGFATTVRDVLRRESAAGGAGIRILTEPITSPVVAAQLRRFLKRFPKATWHQYQPVHRGNVHEGTRLAFGRSLNPVYDLKGAKVVLSLDGDFLTSLPGSVRYAREFADGRRVRRSGAAMNRLYVAESTYTITGASADHRLPLQPSQLDGVARAILASLTGSAAESGTASAWIAALVADLKSAGAGGAVAIPGDEASPSVHALAHAINGALGAIGTRVRYTAPLEAEPVDGVASITALTEAMRGGKVGLLLLLGGNPVYNAPADLKFREAMTATQGERELVPLRVHLGGYEDETSEICHWHLPESHPLEAWGDARAHDGTVSLVQPLIEPLYDSRSLLEVLAYLSEQPTPAYELVRAHYRALSDDAWKTALNQGIIAGTALPTVAVTPRAGLIGALPAPPASASLEVNFRPDPTVWDGRYANNAWLQELPKPITTIVWDNAALVSPGTARKIGMLPETQSPTADAVNIAQVSGRTLVEVTIDGAKLALPLWVLPGQPDGVITLPLGFGRTRGGEVAVGVGFDTYTLRTSRGMDTAVASAAVGRGSYELVFTQPHHLMRSELQEPLADVLHISEKQNRDIVRVLPVAEFANKAGKGESLFHEVEHNTFPLGSPTHTEADEAGHDGEGVESGEVVADWFRKDWKYEAADPSSPSVVNKEGLPSVYPEYSRKGYNQWAMSIDLTTCIGCNVCTIACQAENNIPVVGKEQVGKGREMHWIRIDHYYAGTSFDDVESYFMPVPCMHCEKAPCEPVCPVAATIHSHEGLNQMVYNRCVGTRYCSNNCPYKVRRFNFLKWTQADGGKGTLNFFDRPSLQMLANPDVTVRGRGVMEKCTYCVQRINDVRIEAKKEGREIEDGEIVTACQQACPTGAILFGDINDPNSRISQLKLEPHDYALLADLNTRPRTTYLARITNPNPALARRSGGGEAE